jgi:SOS-response transcriptional repressor LexA
MNFEKNIEILRSHFKTTNAGLEKILGLSNGYIANIGKKETDNPGKLLVGLVGQGISSDWFLTGKGEMFLESEKEEKHPLITDLETLIDQKIEAHLVEIRDCLGKRGLLLPKDPDSGLYASDPEPEYAADTEKAPFVENVAAGRPIYQSEDHTVYIDVPKYLMRGKVEDYYVARIKGTSMTAAGIPDGCLALFRISDVPRDGAIQIVESQGEATLKRIREVPGNGWKICFEDGTKRYIEIGPGEEPRIQGDFVAVLPDDR